MPVLRASLSSLLIAFSLACSPAPHVAAPASTEPSTAAVEEGKEIALVLQPPAGDWKLGEVEVENAKIIGRGSSSPLELRVRRSEPKQGETTVEGADEPIRVTAQWTDRKTGDTAKVVYRVETPSLDEGTKLTVDVTW